MEQTARCSSRKTIEVDIARRRPIGIGTKDSISVYVAGLISDIPSIPSRFCLTEQFEPS